MEASKFTLEINLGNDAMQTPQDVAAKLDQLADVLNGLGEILLPGSRPILDRNGNTVGRWELS